MPPLDRVTPLILTYNEEPNIGRTLARLAWAGRVVVVDSGSEDGTVELVREYSNTDLFTREFDTHARQWNFGLNHVNTEWTLALDADYQVPADTVAEIAAIPNKTLKSGFYAEFDYIVLRRRVTRSLYPARQVLFRTGHAQFEDDGHTQRVVVEGPSGRLTHPVVHEDRKPLDRWLKNQAQYASLEAERLRSSLSSELSWPDRIRRTRVLGPPLVLLYVLIGKGLILEGWPGWYYALERTLAEMVLSLALLRADVGRPESQGAASSADLPKG